MSEKLNVYFDTGGWDNRIKKFSFFDRLNTMGFAPLDGNKNKNLKNIEKPSTPTWKLMAATWCNYTGSWENTKESEKYGAIEDILGKKNIKDAQHIDSAYKCECKFFFTSDENDIISNRGDLEKLLNIKFFNLSKELDEAEKALKEFLK